ncbi:MAG: hypothetical protein ACJ0KD_04070 [Dehalococcoidia bacterium]
MKVLSFVLAICMLSIIGCHNPTEQPEIRLSERESSGEVYIPAYQKNKTRPSSITYGPFPTRAPTSIPTRAPTPLPAPNPAPTSNLIPIRGEIISVLAGCYDPVFREDLRGLRCFLYAGDESNGSLQMWRDDSYHDHFWSVMVRLDQGGVRTLAPIAVHPNDFTPYKVPSSTEPQVGQRWTTDVPPWLLGR